MATQELQSGPISHIELEGELDISSVERLKDQLARTLDSAAGICVSLAGVSALDITAVQLLWAVARQAEMTGTPFTFAPPPDPIVAELREAGIPCSFLLEGES